MSLTVCDNVVTGICWSTVAADITLLLEMETETAEDAQPPGAGLSDIDVGSPDDKAVNDADDGGHQAAETAAFSLYWPPGSRGARAAVVLQRALRASLLGVSGFLWGRAALAAKEAGLSLADEPWAAGAWSDRPSSELADSWAPIAPATDGGTAFSPRALRASAVRAGPLGDTRRVALGCITADFGTSSDGTREGVSPAAILARGSANLLFLILHAYCGLLERTTDPSPSSLGATLALPAACRALASPCALTRLAGWEMLRLFSLRLGEPCALSFREKPAITEVLLFVRRGVDLRDIGPERPVGTGAALHLAHCAAACYGPRVPPQRAALRALKRKQELDSLSLPVFARGLLSPTAGSEGDLERASAALLAVGTAAGVPGYGGTAPSATGVALSTGTASNGRRLGSASGAAGVLRRHYCFELLWGLRLSPLGGAAPGKGVAAAAAAAAMSLAQAPGHSRDLIARCGLFSLCRMALEGEALWGDGTFLIEPAARLLRIERRAAVAGGAGLPASVALEARVLAESAMLAARRRGGRVQTWAAELVVEAELAAQGCGAAGVIPCAGAAAAASVTHVARPALVAAAAEPSLPPGRRLTAALLLAASGPGPLTSPGSSADAARAAVAAWARFCGGGPKGAPDPVAARNASLALVLALGEAAATGGIPPGAGSQDLVAAAGSALVAARAAVGSNATVAAEGALATVIAAVDGRAVTTDAVFGGALVACLEQVGGLSGG